MAEGGAEGQCERARAVQPGDGVRARDVGQLGWVGGYQYGGVRCAGVIMGPVVWRTPIGRGTRPISRWAAAVKLYEMSVKRRGPNRLTCGAPA